MGFHRIFLFILREHYRCYITHADPDSNAQPNAYAYTNRDSNTEPNANSHGNAYTDSGAGNRIY